MVRRKGALPTVHEIIPYRRESSTLSRKNLVDGDFIFACCRKFCNNFAVICLESWKMPGLTVGKAEMIGALFCLSVKNFGWNFRVHIPPPSSEDVFHLTLLIKTLKTH